MNAIIIAAGFGSRLRPLTYETPKPLVKIFGKPIIERNIEFLLEKGIEDIYIVVGYSKEKFEYLKEKYSTTKLIYNDEYYKYNNIYSFYLIRKYLEDSYILDGDIYLTRNVFKNDIKESKYFSKKVDVKNDEWQLIEKNGYINEVQIGGSGNYIMSGIEFFTKENTKILKELVEEYVKDEEKLKKYYWDHLVKENIDKLKIGIEKLDSNDIYEIDNLEELKALDKSYIPILEKTTEAVILAAGKSKEFNIPNGLIKVGNKKIIEHSIEILLKNGIEKIYIVIGYKKEEYFYLTKKYKEVVLLENDEYDEKGSYYSLLKLKEFLNKKIILLDSDIFYEERALTSLLEDVRENIILVSSEKGQKEESFVEEKNGVLHRISKDKRELKNIQGEMLGISKISFKLLENIFKLDIKNPHFAYEFGISECTDDFRINIKRIDELIWGEVDTKEHLEFVEKKVFSRYLQIEEKNKIERIKNIVKKLLKISDELIDNIQPIGGMTNRNYLVSIEGKKYVLRVPGEGTLEIINRKNEKRNAEIVSKLNLDSKLVLFDEETGIKISEFIEEAETLNPITSMDNFQITTNILRKLHNSGIIFNNKFDVFKEIEKYEKLSIEENGIFYDGYKEVKEKVLLLKEKIERLNIELKPCHNDTVPENFIKNKKQIYLIDWEYSGMNDPMWDLAAHSIECEFSEGKEAEFLSYYFNGKVEKEYKLRIEIHKICQDFLWSVWTILKEAKGVSFGDYGIKRFTRAKTGLERLKNYE